MTQATTEAAPFDELVAPHRAELHAHCYRMLGSVADADDALQDALFGAFRGFDGFEGRSSFRAWLYRIATNASLKIIAERPRRVLSSELGPAAAPEAPMGEPVAGGVSLEPYPHDPEARYEELEGVELAFVAALQHLPGGQRAVLVLREVLGFSASEAAQILDTTVAAADSALQRARDTVVKRVPPRTQQATLRELGEAGERELVERFVGAWANQDAGALVRLLAEDVRFTMPPLPNWFDGREAVGRFFAERVFATPWRLHPIRASGQLAFACYQGPDFRLGALNVVTIRAGIISELMGFLDPAVHRRFSLPDR